MNENNKLALGRELNTLSCTSSIMVSMFLAINVVIIGIIATVISNIIYYLIISIIGIICVISFYTEFRKKIILYDNGIVIRSMKLNLKYDDSVIMKRGIKEIAFSKNRSGTTKIILNNGSKISFDNKIWPELRQILSVWEG